MTVVAVDAIRRSCAGRYLRMRVGIGWGMSGGTEGQATATALTTSLTEAGESPRITGSCDGSLFSVQRHPEGLGQVQGRVIQRQPMNHSPEIQDVPFDPARRVKAPKRALAQMNREIAPPARGCAVDRAGTTA